MFQVTTQNLEEIAKKGKTNNDKEYLKENPTGNKDLVLKDYSSMPFIKIPVAQ